jgi:hypothetical protein
VLEEDPVGVEKCADDPRAGAEPAEHRSFAETGLLGQRSQPGGQPCLVVASVRPAGLVTLDKSDVTWCRNPPRSGFGIPLLSPGQSKVFYPDFLAWKANGEDAVPLEKFSNHPASLAMAQPTD